jgi:multidrug efflux pump subunit AcrA (membrane-fusion protein)
VTVVIEEPSSDLRPGMPADVEFTFGEDDDTERFVVPPTAVARDRDGEFVYVVEVAEGGNGVVKRRPVTVNPEPGVDGIEILDGLAADDKLITAGISSITAEMTVKLLEQVDKQ